MQETDATDVARSSDDIRCNHEGDDCNGTVEYRLLPDRSDLRAFPYCDHHFSLRLASAERTLEYLSDTVPSWFDPTYAGENWTED